MSQNLCCILTGFAILLPGAIHKKLLPIRVESGVNVPMTQFMMVMDMTRSIANPEWRWTQLARSLKETPDLRASEVNEDLSSINLPESFQSTEFDCSVRNMLRTRRATSCNQAASLEHSSSKRTPSSNRTFSSERSSSNRTVSEGGSSASSARSPRSSLLSNHTCSYKRSSSNCTVSLEHSTSNTASSLEFSSGLMSSWSTSDCGSVSPGELSVCSLTSERGASSSKPHNHTHSKSLFGSFPSRISSWLKRKKKRNQRTVTPVMSELQSFGKTPDRSSVTNVKFGVITEVPSSTKSERDGFHDDLLDVKKPTVSIKNTAQEQEGRNHLYFDDTFKEKEKEGKRAHILPLMRRQTSRSHEDLLVVRTDGSLSNLASESHGIENIQLYEPESCVTEEFQAESWETKIINVNKQMAMGEEGKVDNRKSLSFTRQKSWSHNDLLDVDLCDSLKIRTNDVLLNDEEEEKEEDKKGEEEDEDIYGPPIIGSGPESLSIHGGHMTEPHTAAKSKVDTGYLGLSDAVIGHPLSQSPTNNATEATEEMPYVGTCDDDSPKEKLYFMGVFGIETEQCPSETNEDFENGEVLWPIIQGISKVKPSNSIQGGSKGVNQDDIKRTFITGHSLGDHPLGCAPDNPTPTESMEDDFVWV